MRNALKGIITPDNIKVIPRKTVTPKIFISLPNSLRARFDPNKAYLITLEEIVTIGVDDIC